MGKFIYSYDRTAEELPMEKLEKHGEWNLHLQKSGSRWRYSMVNPSGGSFGMGSFGSQREAMTRAMAGVDWKKFGKNKTKVWVIVSFWDPEAESYMPKKTFWQDVPKNLLEREPKPLTQEEIWDRATR